MVRSIMVASVWSEHHTGCKYACLRGTWSGSVYVHVRDPYLQLKLGQSLMRACNLHPLTSTRQELYQECCGLFVYTVHTCL